MANSNGWGDGAANNLIGWGQGANNEIAWGDSHAKSWAGATDIVGITTDPDAQAFITAAAITDPTQQTAIDTLVKGMKADGIWTKMKAIYPFVGGTASSHKFNLKDPRDLDAAYRLVFNGGWTHSSTGATPNGTNGYADTKLVPSSVFSNNNNGNFGYYHRTILKNLSASIGAETPYFMDYVTSTGTSVVPSINDPNSVAITITKNAGFRQVSRDASNINNINYQYNNTNYVKTEASTGRTTNAIRIGSSTGLYYSDTQFAFVYFGDTQLTQSEQSNYYTRVQAYQTALSRQV